MSKRLFLFLACLLSFLAHAQEPLEAEQAFRFSAQAIDAQTVEVRWDIAPGYYMYRDKFSFSVEPGTLGKVELPAGQVKEDENFGRVETYRDLVRLQLPVSGASGKITVRATSQGCADIGVCYPPQKHVATLELPVAAAVSVSAPGAVQTQATPSWKDELLQPGVYGPALLGLIGAIFAFRPMRGPRALWFKGLGFCLLLGAAIFMLALNREEPAPPAAAGQSAVQFSPVGSIAELDARLSATASRPVLLDFYADWCGPCREMDAHTFTDAAVRQRLSGLVLLRADVTANTPEHQALLKRYGLQGPPGIILFDAAGRELAKQRIVGFRKPEAFLSALNF